MRLMTQENIPAPAPRKSRHAWVKSLKPGGPCQKIEVTPDEARSIRVTLSNQPGEYTTRKIGNVLYVWRLS